MANIGKLERQGIDISDQIRIEAQVSRCKLNKLSIVISSLQH